MKIEIGTNMLLKAMERMYLRGEISKEQLAKAIVRNMNVPEEDKIKKVRI